MKPASFRPLLLSVGLLTGLGLAGCASHGPSSQKSPGATVAVPAANSLHPRAGSLEVATLQQDSADTREALNRVVYALKRLPFAANPQESYADFSEKFAAFEKLSDQTRFDAAALQKRSQKLATEWRDWAASVQESDRAAATKNLANLRDAYVYMLPTLVFAVNDLNQVTESLRGLKIALAPAATTAALHTNQALVEKVDHHTTASTDSLRNLSERLDLLAPHLAPPVAFTGKRPRF